MSDLTALLDEERRAHERTLEERDAYHDWADRLAFAIGGDEIGEHSNLNNPWRNALDIADRRPPSWELSEAAKLDAYTLFWERGNRRLFWRGILPWNWFNNDIWTAYAMGVRMLEVTQKAAIAASEPSP